MPQTLPEIPLKQRIVNPDGSINLYFRQIWNTLRTIGQLVPTAASYDPGTKTAAIPTTTLFTVTTPGMYRIAFYGRVTVIDGVTSSFQASITYTDGIALTHPGANVNGDTTSSLDKFVIEVYCDANSVIALTVTYASNTPNKMTYRPRATVEQMAA